MGYTKPIPPVSDICFSIRTPSFIVIYGHVIHVMAVQFNREQIMSVGDGVSYKRHGKFKICCIHGGHAVIQHTTLYGRVMNLVVPEEQWLNVSNGTYRTTTPHYDSFLTRYRRLEKTVKQEQVPIGYSSEAFDKYHSLFDAFNGYWKENFAESVQEDKDPLGARIRYGMHCVMQGLPIPTECDYVTLVTEVDEWIGYREGKYD